MLLMGLISLIPIVGQIVMLGWMLAALDNLRAGHQVLPPAGFSYIGRGVNLFVVYVVYGIALLGVFGIAPETAGRRPALDLTGCIQLNTFLVGTGALSDLP